MCFFKERKHLKVVCKLARLVAQIAKLYGMLMVEIPIARMHACMIQVYVCWSRSATPYKE